MTRRPLFVLHEHHRPTHHVDLRLEGGGVLRSWAVPKGLPDDPARDRLAVAVADHDLDHAAYEDDDKRIADTGWWELESRTDRRLVLCLHGRDGTRRYALVDTGQGLAAAPGEGPAEPLGAAGGLLSTARGSTGRAAWFRCSSS